MNEIRLEPGEIVEIAGERCEIVSLLSLNEVEVKKLDDGTIRTVSPSFFKKSELDSPKDSLSFDMLTEQQKQLAKKRYDIISPLLKNDKKKVNVLAEEIADRHKLSIRTIYGWLGKFRRNGIISSLVDKRSTQEGRRSRLSKRQLSIIDRIAREYHESPQKPKMERSVEKVCMACLDAKIAVPGKKAIRRHLQDRDPQRSLAQREGRKAARDQYGAVYGKFPGANYPLAVVQIDHTKLDIELVDDKERLPIGRPNITLALDVFSRAVMGFFVSFENVSLLTTGICLEHAMFPKDDWSELLNINNSWPIWGKPVCLHVDNALEFRSNGLHDFCEEHGVRLEYRPVKTPHYGGHVERILGTIKEQVHTLPGTTFSNVQQKGEYPSSKKAVMTLNAFQQWLGTYITGGYLNKMHSSLGMTPLEKWTQRIRGTDNRPGVGVPPILADREQVRTLLLPTYERSIQREGIRLDHIQYFSPALHVLFVELKGKKQKTTVKIKRDPRDISKIKIFDELRKDWLTVPYRDMRHPSLSLWEWQATQKALEKEQVPKSERALFTAYRRMEAIVEKETRQTRKTRADSVSVWQMPGKTRQTTARALGL